MYLSEVVARVAFYPSLLYNVMVSRLIRRPWYHRIDETVLLGALPFRSMVGHLVEVEKVRAVVSMNEDYEMKFLVNTEEEWQAAGVETLRLSTVDLLATPTVDKLRRGVAFVRRHHVLGNSVYVHCKAGRCRSATLVAAYLVHVHGWTPEQACEHLVSIRPHVLLRPTQISVLHSFQRDGFADTTEELGIRGSRPRS
uniref:phosphatidylglycerophosphatase and protein-tyrosine phosphatase 1 n=1 Tax=Myxine glutinosa TaxID=7769 RepID=UPI00358FD891